jgi:hypothetical protein
VLAVSESEPGFSYDASTQTDAGTIGIVAIVASGG